MNLYHHPGIAFWCFGTFSESQVVESFPFIFLASFAFGGIPAAISLCGNSKED